MLKRILVTGGAGFIGGCFVRQLLAKEEVELINLDLLTYAGNLDSLASIQKHSGYRFVRGSICDQQLVSRLLTEFRPSSIVNFAAESHVDRSIDGPAAFVETNVVGTFRLLEAARHFWAELDESEKGKFRFLHVSTDEVYGSLGPVGKFTETTPYAPNSPYSASKAASDHFVRAYHHTYGLPVVTTNCSNNYGPFQFPEKLIPLMIKNAVSGNSLPIYGTGQNVRDWLYVEDHCRAIELVLNRGIPGEVYNIGGDSERTNLQVVEAICDIIDRLLPDLAHAPTRQLMTFVTDRPGHDMRYAIDASKIQSQLGWRPSKNFEEGLEATIQWYLENQDWVERVTSGKYRGERLGLADNAEHRDSILANENEE